MLRTGSIALGNNGITVENTATLMLTPINAIRLSSGIAIFGIRPEVLNNTSWLIASLTTRLRTRLVC